MRRFFLASIFLLSGASFAADLVSAADGATLLGGLRAGVFPPALLESSSCPQLPQPFRPSARSGFGGHHSYPGGLPLHEANNDRADVALADQYRTSYGSPARDDEDNRAEFFIDEEIVVAAPLWHDWAKPLVFQWI
jgi:hypothetical protein